MSSAIATLAVDALTLFGTVILTLAVVGTARLPNTFARLHAAGQGLVFGVVVVLVATIATGDAALILRALLVAALLVITTPVSAHVLALAESRRRDGDRAQRDTPGSPPASTVAEHHG